MVKSQIDTSKSRAGRKPSWTLAQGFAYWVAVMDWHWRNVLSWHICNVMDTDFCIEALNQAINQYGAPDIFNSDQAAQFTSTAFTDVLIYNTKRKHQTLKSKPDQVYYAD